jgi:UDP-glucose 4-epimerase
MNTLILGGAGFIGTNLAKGLSVFLGKGDCLTLVDNSLSFFDSLQKENFSKGFVYKEATFSVGTDFDSLFQGQDIIYHLASTSIPASSNCDIPKDLQDNIIVTSRMLDAAVRCKVKKIIFMSSGGAIYGKEANCPLSESTPTNPISTYGIEKLTIEKLLYLYNYLYGIDYRVIRLANPYGPYQRPGKLGVVSTFIFNTLTKKPINLYGDGSVVRDFIFIDDAIRAIVTIANGANKHHVFNVGSGRGTSVKEVLEHIESSLKLTVSINHLPARNVDVPVNYLDISRYEKYYGKIESIPLDSGIIRTAEYQRKVYHLDYSS